MMMPKFKGKEINTKPTDGMVSEAKKGLEWRKEYGRGGTEVGVARARDIQNRKELSFSTVKRMYSFFSRHEVDKKAEGFSPGEKGYPSAGRIAWALWGGDAGFSWSRKIAGQLDDDRNEEAVNMDNEVEVEATVESVDEVRTEEVVEETVEETAEAVEETTEEVEEETDRSASPEVQHRAMEMEFSPIDEETRTVKMALSSEEPVGRSFGNEVLDHSKESIDLSFLASGRAPLLLDHDPEKQIGVIKSVQLDEQSRRLRAEVRFGKGELAREAFSDVVDGIKANISVGYSIGKMERDRDDKETYRAKSWKPVEASLVSIPADMTVGVGRSGKAENKPVIKTSLKERNIMSEVNIEAVKAEAQQAAQKNAAQIVELGARHNKSDMAREAIAQGRSIDEFRGELLESIGSTTALESQDIGMNEKEVQNFSMMRAIHALANPTDRRAQEAAAFEFECSRAAAEQYGTTAQGIMLPADVLRTWNKRDLNSADESELFSDDFRGGDFIDALRNQSSVMSAGARMLGGLSGDVKIPKKTAAAAASWIATEGGDASESEMTVGNVSLTPKTLGAFTDVTRQLLIQSSLDVESLIRDDLTKAMAIAIDKAGLEGTGSSGQPTGILNTTGVNTVTNFAAANPTFAEVVSLETAVAEDNALNGNLSYILPASMNGALKTTAKDAGSGQFVSQGGQINGYNAIVSNQATAGNLYFGNFDDLLIGMFGGLDIVVDPYTASKSGTVRVVALQSVDCAVRHAVSFAFGNDGA
jgi:HK97 family phage major capsid protein/HK97 family phage prohead protease